MLLNLILSLFFNNIALAQSEATSISKPIVTIEERKNTITFVTGLASLASDLASVTGIDFGLTLMHAYSDDIALLANIKQGINTSGFGTIYTDLGFGLAYSYSGNGFIKKIQEVSIDGQRSSISSPYNEGGIVFSGLIKQYLFNGTTTTTPFVGVGFMGYYIYPSSERLNLHIGGALDYAQNTDITLTAIKAFVGLQFWL